MRVLYTCDKTREGIKYLPLIEKSNGVRVPLGYFTSTHMRPISAVIFSHAATFGKVRALSNDSKIIRFGFIRYDEKGVPFEGVAGKEDYHETLLDGLHIFHNPLRTYL